MICAVSAIFVNVLSIQSVDVQKTADGFIKTVQLQPHGQVTVTSDGTKLNIKALNCSSSAADSDDKKSVVYTITPGDAPQ